MLHQQLFCGTVKITEVPNALIGFTCSQIWTKKSILDVMHVDE